MLDKPADDNDVLKRYSRHDTANSRAYYLSSSSAAHADILDVWESIPEDRRGLALEVLSGFAAPKPETPPAPPRKDDFGRSG